MGKEFKIDKATYEALQKDLKNLKSNLSLTTKERQKVYEDETMESFNGALYDSIQAEEGYYMARYKDTKEILANSEIVSFNNTRNSVSVNKYVDVDMILPNGEIENCIIKLVVMSDFVNSEIPEVTINSPIGQAIIGKKVGEVETYMVSGETYMIKINEIMTEKKYQEKINKSR